MQDRSNSIANSLELLQSCTKPSKYGIIFELEVEKKWKSKKKKEIDGLVQDGSNSIANSLQLLQSCTKPSKYGIIFELEVEKKWKRKYGIIFQLQVEKK